MMKKSDNHTFRVIIEPDQPKGYHGFVPLLPGIHTCGKTIQEVRQNLKEAIICHLQGLLKDKKAVPQEEEALEIIQTISKKELAVSR
jgi:predicted RNase H-like HicB family nuclease